MTSLLSECEMLSLNCYVFLKLYIKFHFPYVIEEHLWCSSCKKIKLYLAWTGTYFQLRRLEQNENKVPWPRGQRGKHNHVSMIAWGVRKGNRLTLDNAVLETLHFNKKLEDYGWSSFWSGLTWGINNDFSI